MKLWIFISCFLLALYSCSEDEVAGLSVLEIKQDTVVFKNGASSQNVTVVASVEWNANVGEGGDWCTCTVNTGQSNYLKIDVEANKNVEERWTTITVSSDGQKKDITICQFGSAPAILIQPGSFPDVAFEPSTLEMKIISNVQVEISIPDSITWLSKTQEISNGDTTLVSLTTAINISPDKRQTTIAVKQKEGTLVKPVTFIQSGRPAGYEPVKPEGLKGDSILRISSAWTSSFQDNGKIELSFDGDMSTIYHSNWANGGDNYFPITLEYNFEDIDHMDYLIYYPRTDGWNGPFKEVEIWTKTKENPTYALFGTFDFKGSSLATKVDFPQGITNPTGIRFVVKSGAGDNGGFATCAEMMFFQKRELCPVFTDETYSELTSGVTYDQITALDNEFLKNIAKALYLGTYPAMQRVRSYEPYRDADAIAREFKMNPYSPLDNPTGIYAGEGEELMIFVGNIPPGERIGLRQMDWANGYSGTNYTLQSGVNNIKTTGKGLLYVIYNTETWESATPVKVHIATGKVNGLFDSRVNTDADWAGLLKSASASGYLDVVGTYAHLNFPASIYKSTVSSPTRLLEAYDKMVWLEHDLMGVHKYNRTIRNRMFFHAVTGDAYMYATSYRTAYHENTLPEILNVSKFKTSAIWGPAHEVGHMHQTRPGLKWIGLTEVTNNIHSMYVQTTFGNRSRLISEDMGNGATRFESGYVSTVLAQIPHGKEGDVFVKLVPFWQLLLYSSKVMNDADLYKDLHEQVRLQTDPTDRDTKNGICQLNFVKMTCDHLQLDLTEFFRAWGFLREIDEIIEDYSVERLWVTKAQIAELESYIASKNYPKAPAGLIYLNDDNVNCFTTSEAVEPGEATRSGNNVKVTNSKNVVAYEVTQGGKLAKVFNSPSFVIASGSVAIKAVAADGTRMDVAIK